MSELIICVDENGNDIGVAEKIGVHKKGYLHKAFSIFIFNDNGELLLQRRQYDKYHSAGLWSNTCCSHQRINENLNDAVKRRLYEEMGFNTELKKIFSFKYYTKFSNNLIENEYDHVFIGKYNGIISVNNDEVAEYKWMNLQEVIIDIKKNPDNYTYWLKYILENYDVNKYYEEL